LKEIEVQREEERGEEGDRASNCKVRQKKSSEVLPEERRMIPEGLDLWKEMSKWPPLWSRRMNSERN